MVEKDPARGVDAEALAVVHSHPMGKSFGHRIGQARIEGGSLALALLLDHPEHLGGGGLVESCPGTSNAHRFEHVQTAERGHIGGEQRLLPGRLHKGLRREVVDLPRLHVANDAASTSLIYITSIESWRGWARSCRNRSRTAARRSPALLEGRGGGAAVRLSARPAHAHLIPPKRTISADIGSRFVLH